MHGTHQGQPNGNVKSPKTSTNLALALYDTADQLTDSEILVDVSKIYPINPTYKAQTTSIPTEFYSANSTVITTPVVGNVEFINSDLYLTQSTICGRAAEALETTYVLAQDISIATTSDFYANATDATAGIPLSANTYYEIELWGAFLHFGIGAPTITPTYSGGAPTKQLVLYQSGSELLSTWITSRNIRGSYNSSIAGAFTGDTVFNNKEAMFCIYIYVQTGASTTGLKLAWACNGGSSQSNHIGTRWTCRRFPENNSVTL